MSNGTDDSYLGAIIKDFNIKFNIFMGDFQGIKSKLKCDLFSTYCTSYYGWESPFRIPRHLHSCPLRLRTFASCMVGRKDTSGDLRLWTLAVLPRVS